MKDKFKYFVNWLKKTERYLLIRNKLIDVFFFWVYFGAGLFDKFIMVFILLAENSSFICYLLRMPIFKFLYFLYSLFPLPYKLRLIKVNDSIFYKKKKKEEDKKPNEGIQARMVKRMTHIFNKLIYIMDLSYAKVFSYKPMPSIEITYNFINVYFVLKKLFSFIMKLIDYIKFPKLEVSRLYLKKSKIKMNDTVKEVHFNRPELFNKAVAISRIKLLHSKYSYYTTGGSREATIVYNWLEKKLFNSLYSFFEKTFSFELKLLFGIGPDTIFNKPNLKVLYSQGELVGVYFDFKLVLNRNFIFIKIDEISNYFIYYRNEVINKINIGNKKVFIFFERKKLSLLSRLKKLVNWLGEKGERKEEKKRKIEEKRKNEREKKIENEDKKKNERWKIISKFSFLDYFLFNKSKVKAGSFSLNFEEEKPSKNTFLPYKLVFEKKKEKAKMSFKEFEFFVEKTRVWSFWCLLKFLCYGLANIVVLILRNDKFFAFWQYIFNFVGVISVILVLFIELIWFLIGKLAKIIFAVFFLFYLLVSYFRKKK